MPELQMHNPQVVSNPKWDDIYNDEAPVMASRRYTVTDTSDPLGLDDPPSPPEELAEEKEELKEEVPPSPSPAEEPSVVTEETPEQVVDNKEENTEVDAEDTEKKDETVEEQDEGDKHKETFVSDLDTVLKEKTGVDLAGITEALVELLTWRNDILSLEAQQKQQNTQINEPVRPQQPPSFQRSTSKTGSVNPAEGAYDYTYSQILDMAKNNPSEYDRQSQRITQAFMKNRVLMD